MQPHAPNSETSRGTFTADRVADVLLAFATAEKSLGVSALARQLGMSKTVVHRTLQSLVIKGFLQHSPTDRSYSLGPAAIMLGTRALAQLDMREIAQADLIELRNVTGETTYPPTAENHHA